MNVHLLYSHNCTVCVQFLYSNDYSITVKTIIVVLGRGLTALQPAESAELPLTCGYYS